MKRKIEDIRLYWRMTKHEIDREDDQENGLHYKRLEEYEYICDTIEAIEELIKYPRPKTADGKPLENQMEVWAWGDDKDEPEHPTRLLVNMWCAGPDAMVDCLDPETFHGWCCRADELYWWREEAEKARVRLGGEQETDDE